MEPKEDIGQKLMAAVHNTDEPGTQESLTRAMELTRAYASSGSATNFSTISKLFYELFEMFETGKDPRAR